MQGCKRRDDGRQHLGASVEATLAAAKGVLDATVIAYTPFHRPPHRDDVLAGVLEGLRGPLTLADLYQLGQHFVQVPGASVLASYPELDANDDTMDAFGY